MEGDEKSRIGVAVIAGQTYMVPEYRVIMHNKIPIMTKVVYDDEGIESQVLLYAFGLHTLADSCFDQETLSESEDHLINIELYLETYGLLRYTKQVACPIMPQLSIRDTRMMTRMIDCMNRFEHNVIKCIRQRPDGFVVLRGFDLWWLDILIDRTVLDVWCEEYDVSALARRVKAPREITPMWFDTDNDAYIEAAEYDPWYAFTEEVTPTVYADRLHWAARHELGVSEATQRTR